MTEQRPAYTAERKEGNGLGSETLTPSLVDYLRERRRALITELRKIEALLDMPQSIPERKRPR